MSSLGHGSRARLLAFGLLLASACGSGGALPAKNRDTGASTTGSAAGASSGVSSPSSGGGQSFSGATSGAGASGNSSVGNTSGQTRGSDGGDLSDSNGALDVIQGDARDSATSSVNDAADSAEAAAPPNPGVWRTLTPQPSPVDNPLKGFLPYRGTYAFPHSMEWFYVPLRDLMSGPSTFTFATGLEPLLSDIASRGHQAVFRVYLDYPSLPRIRTSWPLSKLSSPPWGLSTTAIRVLGSSPRDCSGSGANGTRTRTTRGLRL